MKTKVWFPGIDERPEKMIRGCLACQLEDGGMSAQPVQATTMPAKPWTDLAMDFYGPLPNSHYLMVFVDEHSWMPIVEEISGTASELVIEALDKIFSLLGKPKVLKTDNGPPFNGAKFGVYAETLGFKHRNVTPLHPRANGQAENFMKNLGRVIRSAGTLDRDWRRVLNEFLRNYRSTPHSTTGVAPSVLMFGENRTNRLPVVVEDAEKIELDAVKEFDAKSKSNASKNANKREKAKDHNFQVGDTLFMLQNRMNKWMSRFSSELYTVIEIKGSMVTVKGKDGRQFSRDASKFKKATVLNEEESESEREEEEVCSTEETTVHESDPNSEGGPATRAKAPRRSERARKEPERLTYTGKPNKK